MLSADETFAPHSNGCYFYLSLLTGITMSKLQFTLALTHMPANAMLKTAPSPRLIPYVSAHHAEFELKQQLEDDGE